MISCIRGFLVSLESLTSGLGLALFFLGAAPATLRSQLFQVDNGMFISFERMFLASSTIRQAVLASLKQPLGHTVLLLSPVSLSVDSTRELLKGRAFLRQVSIAAGLAAASACKVWKPALYSTRARKPLRRDI